MCTLRLVVATFWFLAIANSFAAPETFKIDPARSSIQFRVRHMLGTAKGKFSRFNGTIEVDRERPEDSAVTATIEVASIDTGIAKRDNHLREADFFNVAKFPEITFKSRKVKRTDAREGEIVGDLTMHGVTRPMVLRVLLVGSPDPAAASRVVRWRVSAGPIKRSEFGLVWSKSVEAVSMISEEVNVEMEIEAVRER